MRTSYNKHPLKFGDLFRFLVWLTHPKKIVEFGILDGYSLKSFLSVIDSDCSIEAYDIFDDFVGNHADFESVTNEFSSNSNVSIKKGDFYQQYQYIPDESIDILHIDIANDGSTYEFAIDHYWQKICPGGFLVMEGGSSERDGIEWMLKYEKVPIREFLGRCGIDHTVIDVFPSVTIFRKL